MLTKHEDLLAKIRAAEQAAIDLYNAGAKVQHTVMRLRDTATEIETRIRHYQRTNLSASAEPEAETETQPKGRRRLKAPPEPTAE